MRGAQEVEEHVEGRGRDALLGGKGKGADAVVMTVQILAAHIVVVGVMRVLGISLLAEPAPDVRNFALRIIEAAVDEARGGCLAGGGIKDRSGRIERAQAAAQVPERLGSLRRIDQV